MENISKSVYELLTIRDLFQDAIRGILWSLCKFFYDMCNGIFGAIDDFFDADIFKDLLEKYADEILGISLSLLVLTVKSMPTCFKMSERLGEPDAKIISTINYLLINLNIIDAITIPIIPAIVKLICKAN